MTVANGDPGVGVAGSVAPLEPAAHLPLADLRNGPAELARLLAERAAGGDALNAFLLAAGLRQVTEDHLEPDVLRLAAAERALGTPPAGLGVVLRSARTAAAARRPHGRRALRRFDARLAGLVDALSDAVVEGSIADWAHAAEAAALHADLPGGVAFRRRVLRPPACFRGFDQHPDDIERLAGRFAERFGDRDHPVAVLGLRTSGSYLAPLAAASLRRRGYEAHAFTTRPGLPLPACKRRALRAVIGAGGIVAVVDDPPGSGGSIERACLAIERLGAPRDSVVPMLGLFGGRDGLPAALRRRPTVVLPWSEWSVHERLEPAAIGSALDGLLRPARVRDVVRIPLDDDPRRGHVSARYAISLERPGGAVYAEDVFVRGAGIGYFGDHAAAIADRLRGRVPHVHGLSDGLLFREWVPEERRPASLDPDAVAEYAAGRSDRLTVAADSTTGLTGQDPVWEMAGAVAARAFGRISPAARLAGTDAAMRAALRVRTPSVIDGWMLAESFFTAPDGRGLVKAKPDERDFSNRDLACCDATFDAASAAALNDLDAGAVRAAFERHSGERVDGARWLLYEIVALETAAREGTLSRAEVRRRSARAVQRWFASLYLDDVRHPDPEGGFCALDVDGVLETESLGFPSLSPTGALTLRALHAHGRRAVLVSGRSADEIAERCRAYGLPGGVADYGAAIYDTAGDTVKSLISAGAEAAVERARAALASHPGVSVDGDRIFSVRAWRSDGGRRRPLGEAALRAARAAAGPIALTAIPGECQTDLVPAEVDKGTGLSALVARLEADPARRAVDLAVGDAVADLAMFGVARRAAAPRNADPAVRRSGVPVLRRGYQRGLAQAVTGLLGHHPGDCEICRAPEAGEHARLLLALLGARERGAAGMAVGALRVRRLGRRLGAAG